MSSFTDPLDVRYIPKKNKWKTTREFCYFVGKEGSSDLITVPKGFITDFASIPPIATMFIPKSGKYNGAAVIHDYLYRIKGSIVKPFNNKYRTRKECDKIFLEAMTVLGVPKFKRLLMYRAVRLNIFKKWNKNV